MATATLIKAGSGASDFEQFGATDTIPAANLPARATISPSQITSNQNDYSPTGWADADVVRMDFDANGRAITGFAAWTNGGIKRIVNISGNYGYIPAGSASSSAANRVSGVCDHIIAPYGVIDLVCDTTSNLIRVVYNSFNPLAPFFRGIFHSVCPGATLGGDWGIVGFGISGGNNGVVNPTSTLPGTWEINTSTSATGAASLYLPKGANTPIRFGTAHLVSITYVYFAVLSDGTNTYTFTHGITASNSGTSNTATNSAIIRYTHGTNSGKFEGVCIGTGTANVDLGITVAANTPYVLAVCVDKARSEVRFYIDGSLSGVLTSQIPAAVACGDRTLINKTVGTTSRGACVAYKTFFAVL
jgi:hypothetical protein